MSWCGILPQRNARPCPIWSRGDYRRFVCVEAATVGSPVRLAPGERWEGTQTLEA